MWPLFGTPDFGFFDLLLYRDHFKYAFCHEGHVSVKDVLFGS